MSGHANQALESGRPTHVVVRCSGISEDGLCGRQQLIDAHDAGVGVRVVSAVPDETAAWLTSFGWRQQDRSWLCPFCAASNGRSS